MNRTAHHLGLDVVDCQLMTTAHGPVFIVKRYHRSSDPWPARYHQEDFCQALAFPAHRKYEKERGPSFAQCIALGRKYLGLKDVSRMLDWFLFNLLAGNSDAHAKNISILHGTKSDYRLAPFYDLVCNRAYERLDRKLAMTFGGEFDPDLILSSHIDQLSQEIGITGRLIRTRIKYFLEQLPDARKKALEDLKQQGFSKAILQNMEQIQDKIHKGFVKKFR